MKIIVSNPDTIGDMILRQPLYEALQRAGHELLLLVRPTVLPFARFVAPAASCLTIPGDPYTFRPEGLEPALEELADRLHAFKPDLLVLASYLWTAFEEHLPSLVRDTPVFAMNGFPFTFIADACPESRIAFAKQIDVDPWSHELDKNARLAELIFGQPVPLALPTVKASVQQLTRANEELARLGVQSDQYWIACIGQGPRTIQRNWPLEKWVAVLSHAATRHQFVFLLIGDESEYQSLREVRRLMGPSSDSTILLPPDESDADCLVGVTAMARGYIGRDTGPMHLAAALSKPVIAVFWGAHWPRFTPAAQTARVFTLDVPCRRCEGFCHLNSSYCVTEIPVSAITGAIDELARGGSGCQSVVLPRSSEVALRMETEAALIGRQRLARLEHLDRLVSDLRHEAQRAHDLASSERLHRTQLEMALKGRVHPFE